jgi:hypothetical protein
MPKAVNTTTPVGAVLDTYFFSAVLCPEPLVLYVPPWSLFEDSSGQHSTHLPRPAVLALGRRKLTWLLPRAYTAESEYEIDRAKKQYDVFCAAVPNHRLIMLTNTYKEQQDLTAAGVECLFAPHNQFVSPEAFHPTAPAAPREFDAVYNAAFLPYKRHELLQGTPNVLLVGRAFTPDAAARMRALLPNPQIANEAFPPGAWLTPEQINSCYNRAACGLALSSIEGAMFASMEYLLAGLPVVTTVNLGGRDYYFDGRFVRHVPDDPAAVRSAITAFARCQLPPEFVRAETLRKITQSREAFAHALAERLGLDPESIAARIASNSATHQVFSIALFDEFVARYA